MQSRLPGLVEVEPAASKLDVSQLQSLAEVGFTGGRDSFRALCGRIFQPGAPRFLRTEANALVVFRHADLRAMGVIAAIGNTPPVALGARMNAPSPDEDARAPGSAIAWVLSNQVFFANDPIHGPIRKALLNQIGPKATAQLEGVARALVTEILSGLAGRDDFDLVADVAEPLTVRFWGALLGLTDEEVAVLTPCVRALTPLLYMERTLEEVRRLDEAFLVYAELIERAALRSLAAGGYPFVAGLAADLARIEFDDDPERAGIVPANVGLMLAGNLFDGFHTAALGAANTVYALVRRPEVLAAVRASPELLAGAITEALRMEPPVIMLNRFVLDDVEYDGQIIAKGTTVVMMWGAGNYDPEVFETPELFDPRRSHQGLTTFGGGAHICPGRFVSLMLIRTLLGVLGEQGIELEAADDGDHWLGGHMMCQLSAFPVQVRRRPSSTACPSDQA